MVKYWNSGKELTQTGVETGVSEHLCRLLTESQCPERETSLRLGEERRGRGSGRKTRDRTGSNSQTRAPIGVRGTVGGGPESVGTGPLRFQPPSHPVEGPTMSRPLSSLFTGGDLSKRGEVEVVTEEVLPKVVGT